MTGNQILRPKHTCYQPLHEDLGTIWRCGCGRLWLFSRAWQAWVRAGLVSRIILKRNQREG